MKKLGALFLSMLLVFSQAVPAQAINANDVVDVTTAGGAPAVAAVLLPTATVNTATYEGLDLASGTFTNGTVDGLGINAGVILTTGDISGAVGPNLDATLSFDNLEPGDPALDTILSGQVPASVSLDRAALNVNFTPPAGANLMIIPLVFASEEFSEDIGSAFNDAVAVFVDGVNRAFLPGTTTPITTNSAFGPGAVFNNNDPVQLGTPPFGLQYDAFTNVITLRIPITADVPHDIRIAIADGGSAAIPDALFDSAVFVGPITFATAAGAEIGIYNAGTWFLDVNDTGTWDDVPADGSPFFGFPGSTAVVGDWNGSGTKKIGVYADGFWYLDIDGNGAWDGEPTDRIANFGFPGATPVAGDWTGTGTDRIGVYADGFWYLDLDGNGAWDGEPIDRIANFGFVGAVPVVGDWSGNGTTKLGVYANAFWYLDMNGNNVWDGQPADRIANFGFAGAMPVAGDWNGIGFDQVGVYADGFWYLDSNGTYAWENGVDTLNHFGFAGAQPVVGIWEPAVQ